MPTVGELEQKAKVGEPISLIDLANAIHADKERGKEEKPSIRAQLRAAKEQTARRKAQRSRPPKERRKGAKHRIWKGTDRMQKFENVDILACLDAVMKQNTGFYQSDFEIDKKIIHEAAASPDCEDRTLL